MTGDSVERIVSDYSSQNTLKFKQDLSDVLITELTPIGNEIQRLLTSERAYLDEVLRAGQSRAQAIASVNMQEIRKLVGLGGWTKFWWGSVFNFFFFKKAVTQTPQDSWAEEEGGGGGVEVQNEEFEKNSHFWFIGFKMRIWEHFNFRFLSFSLVAKAVLNLKTANWIILIVFPFSFFLGVWISLKIKRNERQIPFGFAILKKKKKKKKETQQKESFIKKKTTGEFLYVFRVSYSLHIFVHS